MATPDLPAEAVEAAARVLRDVALVGTYWTLSGGPVDPVREEAMDRAGDLGTAAAVLAAAAPHLRAQVLAEVDAADLAQTFHETYERLAPDFGYRTREASAKPWADVPEQNRALMVATCAAVIQHLADTLGAGGVS